MLNYILELLEFKFILHAVIAAFFASITCGFIGSVIVEKRLVSISGGIAHASFGGVGLGFLLSFEPVLGALVFALISALLIGLIRRRNYGYSDTFISIFWSVGMSLGIIFTALTPSYTPSMSSYLFGNILTVSSYNLILMGILTLVIVFVILLFYNYWLAFIFDEEYLKSQSINVTLLDNVLMILIALCVVSIVKVVGVVLSLALFTIPPSIAKVFSYDFKKIIFLSSFLGMLFSLSGLSISYILNIPAGPTIVVFSSLCFILARVYTTYFAK